LNYTRTVVSIQLEDNNIHIVSLSTALRKIYKKSLHCIIAPAL